MTVRAAALAPFQQTALILLRTAIGWHFLYEGYFKLVDPAWSRAGTPLEPFSSGGYLQSASGPLAAIFRSMAHPAWLPWIDGAVAVALVLAGLMLMLGLLTQLGCAIAVLLLTAFYLSAMPLTGLPMPRTEGTYLIVNKNLIELLAVAVLMAFRTGQIAGLDLLLRRRAAPPVQAPETTS